MVDVTGGEGKGGVEAVVEETTGRTRVPWTAGFVVGGLVGGVVAPVAPAPPVPTPSVGAPVAATAGDVADSAAVNVAPLPAAPAPLPAPVEEGSGLTSAVGVSFLKMALNPT